MKYATYEKYKDSGVPWIGKIPTRWEVRRLKDAGRLIGGAGFPLDLQGTEGGELFFYKVGDLSLSDDGKTLVGSPHTISRDTARTLRAAIIPPNAVVYAKIGAALLLNRRRVTTAACCIDNNMTAYIPNFEKLFSSWAFYWLSTVDFGEHTNPGAVPSFSEGYQSILPIPIPSLEEQNAISTFLDSKIAEIDALIAKKEELLKLLAEQRTALITHAVAKGLNPKAKMKDSGIEWLGSIPAHWDAKKLKFSAQLINEKVEAASVDLDYMGLEQITSWTGKRINSETAESEGTVNVFRAGDVLFGKLRPYLAKVYLADKHGTCSTEAFVLRTGDEILPEFLQLYMLTDKFIKIVDSTTYGAKMPRANWDSVGNLMTPLPPLEEQKQIVAHVRKSVSRIESVCAITQKGIDRLKEYRTALITNAVTGKIKVV